MSRKNIILPLIAAGAIGISFIADATIYLMKGKTVVATYADDEVEYITFDTPEDPELPETYDVDTRSFFVYSNYYGDTMEKYGYDFAVQMMDLEADDKGNIPTSATYYMLRLNAGAPAEKDNPCLPEGSYSLCEAGKHGVLDNELSYVRDGGVQHFFKELVLTVSNTEDKSRYELTAIADNDKTYHTVFDGVPEAYDQSITWLEEDQHIIGGTLIATYLADGINKGCNINITIAENGYDSAGWLNIPGNYVTLVGNVDMDEKGILKTGSWTITNDQETTPLNTLRCGTTVNFGGSAYPVDTNVRHYDENNNISVGLIESGTVNLSKKGSSYTVTYNFTTFNGKKVSGSWSGPIKVENHPYEKSLLLESDYQLDFSTDATASCYNLGEQYLLEVRTFNDRFAYMGDRVELRILAEDGVKPGIYSIDDEAGASGRLVPGKWDVTYGGNGSVFAQYSNDGAQSVIKAAGINGGRVELKKNSDGTWTIDYDLLDGQESPKRITGSWTGKIEGL